jgi:NAD(P)-dependent dehydrogenase (short-subunit alcohol dehydrogenase family)
MDRNNKKLYVLVTGASRGIGEASALYLDKLGFIVFAGIRKEEDGLKLKKNSSNRIMPVYLEITDSQSIEKAARTVSNEVGEHGLYGLVNNAGIAIAGPLELIPVDKIREQFEINVVGQIAIIQTFLPLLRKANGRIINISSKEGLLATPFVGPYCAAKFAMEAFSDVLRIELKPWKIPVSIIEPGVVATQLPRKSLNDAEILISQLPGQASDLYNSCIANVRGIAENIINSAISADKVAITIAKALTASKPKNRYVVGGDARLIAFLAKFVPEWLRDRMIIKQLKI